MIGNLALALNLAGCVCSVLLVRRAVPRAVTTTRLEGYSHLLNALDDAAQALTIDNEPTSLRNVLAQVRVAYEVRAGLDVNIIHEGHE